MMLIININCVDKDDSSKGNSNVKSYKIKMIIY